MTDGQRTYQPNTAYREPLEVSMRIAIAITVVAVSTLAVNAADEVRPMAAGKQIIAKWELDTVRTVAKLSEEAKTDEEKAALEFAKGFLSSMKLSFEFTADGKMLLQFSGPLAGEKEREEGTFKIKSEKKLSVVITGTVDGDTKDVTIKIVDKNTIEMHMPEDEGPGVMVLKRAKKKQKKE